MVNIEKVEKIARLISVVAIAMVLTIAFSGVASASWLAELTPEKQNFNTVIGYDRTVTGDQGFDFWKSSSRNLLNTGNVKYNENMIGAGVATDFNKNFNVFTGTGYTSKFGSLPITPASWKEMNDNGGLGSRLSYEEWSSAYGEFEFHKVIDYTSKIKMP